MAVTTAARLLGALLLALALAVCALAAPTAGAQTDAMRISVDDAYISADGGRATITVHLPQAAASSEVTLTTDLGAFGADSGPGRVVVQPDAANDREVSVVLVGDRRAGVAVVTARAGSMVAAATVTFVGPPAQIVFLRSLGEKPLDASRAHVVQLEVRDAAGRAVPGAPLLLEVLSSAGSSTLRSTTGESASILAQRTAANGRAVATLRAAPGALELRARSERVAASLPLTMHGVPASLHLRLLGDVLERGSRSSQVVLLARMLDAGGHAVPGQRVSLTAEPGSGIEFGDSAAANDLVTDAAGEVAVRATAPSARTGSYWVRAEASGNARLGDATEITVVGAPAAIYLTATRANSPESARAGADEQEYVLSAEVVDPTGRAVAEGYSIRWRVALQSGEVRLSPEDSSVFQGGSTARLWLRNADPEVAVQAWLIENPQINAKGAIKDLAASGLALRPGLNVVTWIGAVKAVDAAVASIAHLSVTVWRARSGGAGWQAYTTAGAPNGEIYDLSPGDRLHIRLDSAARLPGVER